MRILLCFLLIGSAPAWAWVALPPLAQRRADAPTNQRLVVMHGDRFNRDLEERSMRNVKGGAGETVAGAVLGGLLFGPFGALFGAQVGSNFGAKNAVERAKMEEMKRMGLSQEMLDAAQDCGVALQQSMEGLEATQESLNTLQSIARRLDREETELYEKATNAIKNDDEETARKYLLQRTDVQDKLKKVLQQCLDEKKRMATMESNVEAIKTRAMEIESLLQRSIGAKARQDSSQFMDFSLSKEDPLLKKFRDAGID